MSATLDLRCPICLDSKRVARDIETKADIQCGGCHRSYTLATALPARSNVSEKRVSKRRRSSGGYQLWLGILIPIIGIFVSWSSSAIDHGRFFFGMACYILLTNYLNWALYDKEVTRLMQVWFLGSLFIIALNREYVMMQPTYEEFHAFRVLVSIGMFLYVVRVNFGSGGGGGDSHRDTLFEITLGDCSSGCGSSCGGCGGCG